MSNTTELGLVLGKLPKLKPVLQEWQALNQEKHWFYDGDAPWWYNERASLSIFAGAVWRRKGWAFEEFSTRKGIRRPLGKAKFKSGRCDIQFGIGSCQFVAEAKQCWITLCSNKGTSRRDIESAIEQAREDVLKVQDWSLSRLGIIFVVPQVHTSKQKAIEELLRDFIEQLLVIKNTTIAWIFPKSRRDLRPPEGNKARDYIYPGVAVLLSVVNMYPPLAVQTAG